MLDQPLVTAIITTCARPRLVGRAIDSVFAQTYPNLECVVVNDGTDAETRDVLAAKQAEYPALRVIQQPEQRGLSVARNTGMEAAQGAFVAFLDDDDVWLPAKIGLQVARILDAGPQCGLAYAWFELRRGDEVVGGRQPVLEGMIFPQLIVSQPLGNGSTYLVRREAALAIGGFDSSLQRGIDGDFVRRLAVDWSIACVPQVLAHLFVGHEYERITTDNAVGLRRALRGHKVKLEKFPALASDFPLETASLHGIIALHHAKLREFGGARTHLAQAFRIRPLSPAVWRSAAGVARAMVTQSLSGAAGGSNDERR